MPAFPIHTLFEHMCGAGLISVNHPLSDALKKEWIYSVPILDKAKFNKR
jgi:hypothetical protein